MDADLDTLAMALYVRTDDLLKAPPERAPWRPKIGIAPKDLVGWAETATAPATPGSSGGGLRLYLLCTLHGLPVGFAVTGAKADERQTLLLSRPIPS